MLENTTLQSKKNKHYSSSVPNGRLNFEEMPNLEFGTKFSMCQILVPYLLIINVIDLTCVEIFDTLLDNYLLLLLFALFLFCFSFVWGTHSIAIKY